LRYRSAGSFFHTHTFHRTSAYPSLPQIRQFATISRAFYRGWGERSFFFFSFFTFSIFSRDYKPQTEIAEADNILEVSHRIHAMQNKWMNFKETVRPDLDLPESGTIG
jgi:hypothetical protein